MIAPRFSATHVEATGGAVVTIAGEVSADMTIGFVEAVLGTSRDSQTVLDMAAVGEIDRASLERLCIEQRRRMAGGCAMQVRNPSAAVCRSLLSTDHGHLLEVRPSSWRCLDGLTERRGLTLGVPSVVAGAALA